MRTSFAWLLLLMQAAACHFSMSLLGIDHVWCDLVCMQV